MRPFCDPYVSSASDWNSKNALTLIRKGDCPAWVLSSKPVLGRCMPAREQLRDNSQRIRASQNIRFPDSQNIPDIGN